MNRPQLLVLAAGIGSRYGGLKQIDAMGPSGEVLMDYSIYDALQAGFEKVVFVIREEIEEVFEQNVGNILKDYIDTEYAYQTLDHLPEGYDVPENRKRPWGTAHAILCAQEQLNGPFAVINADDFYGRDAFQKLYDNLSKSPEEEKENTTNDQYYLIGYALKHTLSQHGHVTRGICEIDDHQKLQEIVEREKIKKYEEGIKFQDEKGQLHPLDPETTVSMNIWGFTQSIFPALKERFPEFLDQHADDPSAEYLLPTEINRIIQEGRADVNVKPTDAEWFGVTFKEDREDAKEAINELVEEGEYPEQLWD